MRLDPARIASESHVLVPAKPRHVIGVLVAVERALAASMVRSLRWRAAIVRTWHILPRPGVRCVVIQHRHLREWTVCITARREGTLISVGWYLIAKPSWRGDLRRLLKLRSSIRERETIGSELSFRRRSDLNNLSSISRDALQRAIDEISSRSAGGSDRSRRHRRRRGNGWSS